MRSRPRRPLSWNRTLDSRPFSPYVYMYMLWHFSIMFDIISLFDLCTVSFLCSHWPLFGRNLVPVTIIIINLHIEYVLRQTTWCKHIFCSHWRLFGCNLGPVTIIIINLPVKYLVRQKTWCKHIFYIFFVCLQIANCLNYKYLFIYATCN